MKEKLQRVQAVRKWLEKAERSFLRHQDISGEWNLIMAQAEMQRLKETDHTSRRFRQWGSRVLALAAAAVLVSGYALWDSRQQDVAVSKVQPAGRTEASLSAAKEAPPAGQPIPAGTAEVPSPEPYTAPSVETGPAAQTGPVAPASAAPVLTEWEIQSVVGEAGRTLRGQS